MSRPSSSGGAAAGLAGSPEGSFGEHEQEHEHEQDESQSSSEEPWKALSTIIRDTGPTLSADEELENLAAAEAAVNAKDQERAAVIDQMQEDLRQLSRQLQQASTAAQRPASHPSSTEHEAQVRSLEQQQYSTVKQLNEEQGAVAKKEVELSKWRSMKDDVDKIQVEDRKDDGWANGKM
ncbi:kinetochore protein Spc24 [Kwoniella heveanensis BCC8398]|uniref:Kinetochore protein Spc24 n=1 Tax=Kwoniella heveanensis BCC8398 TaxID=1296120 RepID=A0A1B9GUQ0_9TREE|nr:kinetochore protein Spc24 [Kwoniella heveanensis BCC8398]